MSTVLSIICNQVKSTLSSSHPVMMSKAASLTSQMQKKHLKQDRKEEQLALQGLCTIPELRVAHQNDAHKFAFNTQKTLPRRAICVGALQLHETNSSHVVFRFLRENPRILLPLNAVVNAQFTAFTIYYCARSEARNTCRLKR